MQCHECGAAISDKAADCPYCGTSVSDGSEDPAVQGPDGARSASPAGGETGGDRGGGTADADDDVLAGQSTVIDDEDDVDDVDDGDGVDDGDDVDAGDDVDDRDDVDDGDGVDAGDDVDDGDDVDGSVDEGETRSTEPTYDEFGRATDDGPADVDEASDGDASGSPAASPSVPASGASEDGTAEDGRPGADDAVTDSGGSGERGEEAVAGSVEAGVGGQAPVSSGQEPSTPGSPTGGPGTVGGSESVDDQSVETDPGTAEQPGSTDARETGDGFDPVSFVTGIPWLPSAVAGVATALVVFILSVLVAVVIPSVDADALEFGALVLFDLHFATPLHETPLVFDNFDVARPPDAALGLLYLIPPLLVYTASKAVVAFNVDDERSLPFAALSGATLVVGYFPVVLVALFVAPARTGGLVEVFGAIVIAGLIYPLLFGTIGGLFGGAYTGMERNVGTLYGLVTFFLVMVATFVLSFPAFGNVVDVDLLSRVLLSLFTIVGANAFSLGGSGTNVAILLVYPLMAGAVFVAGFVRAFRAPDVESPLRGFAKGVTPAGTYVVLLGVLASVLPVFADGYVQEELGMGFGASVVIDSLVFGHLVGIGQYATVLVVGTLVYPVVLGGGAGALAGGIRYATSD